MKLAAWAFLLFCIAVVAWKEVRGAAWDREHLRQDGIRRDIMRREARVLSDQGWHRDSTTGMWTP